MIFSEVVLFAFSQPKNGCPQVRMLTDEPIRIIENHFSVPPGKSDVLKAPDHYPDPLFLLTLQEMSLVWHLYGGNDFKKSKTLFIYIKVNVN